MLKKEFWNKPMSRGDYGVIAIASLLMCCGFYVYIYWEKIWIVISSIWEVWFRKKQTNRDELNEEGA